MSHYIRHNTMHNNVKTSKITILKSFYNKTSCIMSLIIDYLYNRRWYRCKKKEEKTFLKDLIIYYY